MSTCQCTYQTDEDGYTKKVLICVCQKPTTGRAKRCADCQRGQHQLMDVREVAKKTQ